MELLNLPIEMHNCILNEIKDDSTTSAFTVLNKVTMVSKYFQPLATENIVIRNLVPKAKFRKGSIVRYNQEWVKQCKERLEPLIKQYGGSLGQQPFGRLIIYSDPRWDSKNKPLDMHMNMECLVIMKVMHLKRFTIIFIND